MDAARTAWYRVPVSMAFDAGFLSISTAVPAVPVPSVSNSYGSMEAIQCTEVSYPRYVLGIASVRPRAGNGSASIRMALPNVTFGPSRSTLLLPSTRDPRMFRCGSPDSFHRKNNFDSIKEHSEWYKHLDLDDEVFIPCFRSSESPSGSQAMMSFHFREKTSRGSTTPRQTKNSTSGFINSEPDAWHIRLSTPNSVSSSGNGVEPTLATLPTPASTSSNNSRRGIGISNSSSSHFIQFSLSQPPPQSQPLDKTTPNMIKPSGGYQSAQEIAREIMAEQQRISTRHGTHIHAPFIPSRAVLKRNGQKLGGTEAFGWRAGRFDDEANHYGQHIEDHKNCAIFMTGIPIEAAYADVLGSIRGGKIYASRFEPDNDKFPTRAMKLVFFTRISAELFMEQNYRVGIFILGTRVRAIWNRIRYDAHDEAHQSRVVNITGLERWMRSAFLEDCFKRRFEYDLDRTVDVPCPRQGYVTRAWHFACLRSQALFAKMIIERELSDVFTAEYGTDPCDRPWL